MRKRLLILMLLLTSACSFILAATEEEVSQKPKFGVLCAHPKEFEQVFAEMGSQVACELVGGREYLRGKLWGIETVVAVSRVGKVAAAMTATHLIESCDVDAIIFVGVAGAVDSELSQGDVVVAEDLVQYDLDARPLTPRFSVPLLNISNFNTDPTLRKRGVRAVDAFFEASGRTHKRVHVGLIGTGDRFVSDSAEKKALKGLLPNLLAVDMEGAAVAQACYEHEMPFVVIRVISDACDGDAAPDCMRFLRDEAPVYSREVLKHMFCYFDR